MGRTYYLNIQEQTPNGGRYVMQYTDGEMAEMFSDEQMASLAAGDTITWGLSRVTDLEAFFDSRA